jgi:endoglucanase
MRAKILLAVLALLVPSQALGESQSSCVANATSGVAGSRLSLLARGFNLTGWMDGESRRRPDFALLGMLQARGLTHVRLPVAPELLLGSFSDRHAIANQLNELDFAIQKLLEIGFGVSLDVHPGGKFSRLHASNPDEGFRLLQSLWRTLGRRYRGYSAERLFLEVLNEPSIPEKIWNEQGPRLVETMRREAPEHTIIYGPASYQQISALLGIQPLSDTNIVYAIHFYEPMIFTHQGLTWSNDPLRYLHGVPFPTNLSDPRMLDLTNRLVQAGQSDAAALLRSQLRSPWDERRVVSAIARAADWARRNGRPIVLNEFGVLGWKAPAQDRARWINVVRRAAESHCIGWTHWEYADGFGFVRRSEKGESPDHAILEALVGSLSFKRQGPN